MVLRPPASNFGLKAKVILDHLTTKDKFMVVEDQSK